MAAVVVESKEEQTKVNVGGALESKDGQVGAEHRVRGDRKGGLVLPLHSVSVKRKLFFSPWRCAVRCTASCAKGGSHVRGCQLTFPSFALYPPLDVILERRAPASSCVVWFGTCREGKCVVKIGDATRIANEGRVLDHLASQKACAYTFGRRIRSLLDVDVGRAYIAVWAHEGSMDLLSFLADNSQLDLAFRQKICLEVVRLLWQLHVLQVAHLDLKPENILISFLPSGLWYLSLIDYDASVIHPFPSSKLHEPLHRRFGTLGYRAPEVSEETRFNPYAADMWSLGVTLYVILTGQGLFPHTGDAECCRRLQESLLLKTFSFPDCIPKHMVHTLQSLLTTVDVRQTSLATVGRDLLSLPCSHPLSSKAATTPIPCSK